MENKGKVKAILLASVASMIDLFNKGNIAILELIGCQVGWQSFRSSHEVLESS